MSADKKTQNKNNLDNGAELSVILTEIDKLEKGLSFEEVSIRPVAKAVKEVTVKEVKVKSLQEQIDEELALAFLEAKKFMSDSSMSTESAYTTELTSEEPEETLGVENVLPFEISNVKVEESKAEEVSSSAIQLATKGHLNMSLEMALGNCSATVNLDSKNGIIVNVEDMKIHIDPENGCIIQLKNGMNFTIPLSVNDFETKKKVS